MVWIDYIMLAVVILSVIFSLIRGFVREAISLGTWVVALWLGLTFAEPLSRWFTGIDSDVFRIILAFAILFVAVLLVGALLNHVFTTLVDKTGLSGSDRLIGAVFGFARGLVLVAVLIVVANWTTLPESKAWSESKFVPVVNPVAVWLTNVLPMNVTKRNDTV